MGLVGASGARAIAAEADQQTPPRACLRRSGRAPAWGRRSRRPRSPRRRSSRRCDYTPAERAQAAGNWRVSLAPLYERRTGPRQGRPRSRPRAGQPLGSRAGPGVAAPACGAASCGARRHQRRCRRATKTSRSRACPRCRSWIAVERALLRAPHAHLPRSAGALPAEAQLHHHPDAGPGPRPGAPGRRGDRRRQVPRAAPRDPLGRQGPAWTPRASPRPTEPSPSATGSEKDAAVVVERLHQAGAVLVAKLSLGALALNDIWFGGQTNNPWLLEEGASGSSAGPGAATAAGCVAFALASETGGSIIAPAMRCGVVGLRPTYGRVPRTGAMTLCWSLDKLGPMARGVEDTLLVLHALSGPDAGDVASVPSRPRLRRRRRRPGPSRRLLPQVDGRAAGHRRGPRRPGDAARDRHEARGGRAARLALRVAQHDPVRGGRGGLRGADSRPRRSTSSRCRCPTPGPTSSGSRASSRRWTSSRPTACAAGSRARWRASSARSTCFSCPRCATRCSPSPTRPGTRP